MKGVEVDNSVLNRAKDLTDVEVPGSALEKGLGECYFHSAAAGTSSTPFQIPQERTNDNDNLTFLDWPGEGIHVWVLLRKKGIEKLAFGSDYDHVFYTPPVERPSNWADYILQPSPVEKLRLVSRDTVSRIRGFASLDDNWDSYGAKTIEWSVIIKAVEFFSNLVVRLPDNAALPFVAPAGNGDIHFEWEMLSKALALSIPEDKNDAFEYVLTDKTSGKEGETYGRVSSMEEIIDIAANWIR